MTSINAQLPVSAMHTFSRNPNPNASHLQMMVYNKSNLVFVVHHELGRKHLLEKPSTRGLNFPKSNTTIETRNNGRNEV